MFVLETLLASLTRFTWEASVKLYFHSDLPLSSSPLFDCFGKSGLWMMRKDLESTVFRFSHQHKFTQSAKTRTETLLRESIRAGNGWVNLVKSNRLWFHMLFRASRWHGGRKFPSLSLCLFPFLSPTLSFLVVCPHCSHLLPFFLSFCLVYSVCEGEGVMMSSPMVVCPMNALINKHQHEMLLDHFGYFLCVLHYKKDARV